MKWTLREDWPDAEAPDLYFTRAYLDLYRGPAVRPWLFEFRDGDDAWRLPYLESEVRAHFPQAPEGLRDIEGAYGYGGPWTTRRDAGFLEAAGQAFAECCRERRVVAAFLRFHPLLGNHDALPGFEILPERETICVDLADGDIWNHQVSPRNRNKIRRAEKAGVTFEADPGFRHLDRFRALYAGTMDALGAESFYRFPDAYFESIRDGLGEHAFLVHCRQGGEIIASALLFAWGRLGHYHLGASSRDHLDSYPNNLMLYRSAEALRAKGCERFHLGGGTTSDPEDLLLRFKRSFSHHALRFHIGKRVFLEAEYARLRELWAAVPGKNASAGSRILFYRY